MREFIQKVMIKNNRRFFHILLFLIIIFSCTTRPPEIDGREGDESQTLAEIESIEIESVEMESVEFREELRTDPERNEEGGTNDVIEVSRKERFISLMEDVSGESLKQEILKYYNQEETGFSRELIPWLKEELAGRGAVEIGSGTPFYSDPLCSVRIDSGSPESIRISFSGRMDSRFSLPDRPVSRELIYGGDGSYRNYDRLDIRNKTIVIDLTGKPAGWDTAALFQAEEWGASAVIFFSESIPSKETGSCSSSGKSLAAIPGIFISRSDGLYLKGIIADGNVECEFRKLSGTDIFPSLHRGRLYSAIQDFEIEPGETPVSDLFFYFEFRNESGRWAEQLALFLSVAEVLSKIEGPFPRIFYAIHINERNNSSSEFILSSDRTRVGDVRIPKYQGLYREYHVPEDEEAVFSRRIMESWNIDSLANLLFTPPEEYTSEDLTSPLKKMIRILAPGNPWMAGEGIRAWGDLADRISETGEELITLLETGMKTEPTVKTGFLSSLSAINFIFHEWEDGFRALAEKRMYLNRGKIFLTDKQIGPALDEAFLMIEGAYLSGRFSRGVIIRTGELIPVDLASLIFSLELKRHHGGDVSGELAEIRFWMEQFDTELLSLLEEVMEILIHLEADITASASNRISGYFS